MNVRKFCNGLIIFTLLLSALLAAQRTATRAALQTPNDALDFYQDVFENERTSDTTPKQVESVREEDVFVDSGQSIGNSISYAVALGDLNADGHLDAFVVNGSYQQIEANKVWLNNGSGVFGDSGQEIGEKYSVHVALGDLDSDGDLDAFVTNGSYGSGQPNEVWLNDGSGVFSDSGQELGDIFSVRVRLGDLDGDDDLDAYIVNAHGMGSEDGNNEVWVNDGSGNFTLKSTLNISRSLSADLGDLDGDGDLDAYVARSQVGDQVWLNDGSGNFGDSGQNFHLNSSNNDVVLGDMDGDGDLDAFVVEWGLHGSPNQLWLNDGKGYFQDSGQSLGNAASASAALKDVDQDGDLDVSVANSENEGGGHANALWLNDGLGNFSLGQNMGSTFSNYVALADLDRDGALDIFTANGWLGPQANEVWFNQQQITITDHVYLPLVFNGVEP